MELTEKKCTEISKKANDFIKMYKDQINDFDFRDNFLDIALDSFSNEDDMNLFKCFVIFNNPNLFLEDYKKNNKDITKIAKMYHTDESIVTLFLDVLKSFSKNNKHKPIRQTRQNLRNHRQSLIEKNNRQSLIEENKYLRKRIIELENMLKEKNTSLKK